jgi:hypothetical protein
MNEFLRCANSFERVRNVFGAGFIARARHWRRVAGVGRLSWVGGAVFVALLMITRWVDLKPTKNDQLAVLIVIPALLSLIMPAIFTMTTWAQRWDLLASESLRPAISRARFVREQGAAMALDLAVVWASITVGLFATALIYRPAWLFTSTVAAILFRSAAAQVWIFSIGVWTLRHRTWRWLGFVSFVGALLLVSIVTGRAFDGPKGTLNPPSPLVSAAFLVAGVIITLDAHRRWLKTDLD